MNNSGTPIQSLAEQLRNRFQEARISLDEPSKKDGRWFLDVEDNGHLVVVQWKDGFGMGISCSPEHSYGEGADEVYQDLEAAYSRIVCLLISRTYTSPPACVRMSDLRKERGVSQEGLAALLDVRQAAVSKLERRSDVLVSSIREVIRSMGGELRIIAKFPDGMERALEFEEGTVTATKRAKATTSERR